MPEAHAYSLSQLDHSRLHGELIERRNMLETAAARSDADQLAELLDAVDEALHRMEHGDFGICEVCDAPIESEILLDDPLAKICLECLSTDQRRALEHDLSLASSIQRRLLPQQEFDAPGWEGYYHYEPHGVVSGDFCDVIRDGEETLVLLGDISGKGVSAALLMSHLSAIFRGLSDSGAPLVSIMERANRLFSAAIPAGSFATMVAVRLRPDGEVELSNAGHVPPIVHNGHIDRHPTACHSDSSASRPTPRSSFAWRSGIVWYWSPMVSSRAPTATTPNTASTLLPHSCNPTRTWDPAIWPITS
jgi:sigma-B regulation protein RsbU (phosphoserine phosphatase)